VGAATITRSINPDNVVWMLVASDYSLQNGDQCFEDARSGDQVSNNFVVYLIVCCKHDIVFFDDCPW
jgi:hypothetical protein